MRLSELVSFVADSGSSGSDKIAVFSMVSALGVALVYGAAGIITAKMGAKGAPTASRKVAREHEAWERWMLLNNIDPRKVKTGYEPLEEVRHADDP